ncbi:MAG: hypothetical protein LBU43_05440 [Candidatus Accumulibacter sp.]|jgi:hypothetical protein|nr:hypothetical protein [Accumulibacter sp.]
MKLKQTPFLMVDGADTQAASPSPGTPPNGILRNALEGAQRLASSAAEATTDAMKQTQEALKRGGVWTGEALQGAATGALRLADGTAEAAGEAVRQTQETLKRGVAWTGEALQSTVESAQRLADGAAEATANATRQAFGVWQRQSNDSQEAAAIETDKKKQLLNLIDELEKRPYDRLRLLGDIGIGTFGALAGGAAAGTLAMAAGATSIPVITMAASAFGLSVVAATPVGWVIGAGAAGATTAYGISRLIHGGGKSEARMEHLRQSYAKQVKEMEARERQAEVTEDDKTQFIVSMRALIEQNRLPADTARRLMAAVESGKMPISRAYGHLEALAGKVQQ